MAKTEVRPIERRDAAKIADLYNLYGYGTRHYGYPLTAEDIEREIVERGTVLFLVAVHESGQVVGTMSFHPVSGQKAAPPGAIWGGSFFIHPQFRLGQIPAQLFTRGMEFLVAAGYDRIDTEVSPTNRTALALYKRVGFYRTHKSRIDGDDFLELVNYVPYLARYFKRALQLEKWDGSELMQGWKNMLPPSTSRSLETDSQTWHGCEVLRYSLNIGTAKLNCLIDVNTQKVVSIDSNIFVFECYPADDRSRMSPGENVKFLYRYKNNSQNTYRMSLVMQWEGDTEKTLAEGKILKTGDQWQEEVALSIPHGPGRLELVNHLYLEEMTASGINRFHFPVVFGVEAAEHAVSEGDIPSPAAVLSPWETRVLEETWGWLMENAWLQARFNKHTGCLDIIEQSSGATMIREPWPEVGPPYPGGFKSPPDRPLRLVNLQNRGGQAELVLESPANIWWWRDDVSLSRHWPQGHALAGCTVRRRYILGTGQMLAVETQLIGKSFQTGDASHHGVLDKPGSAGANFNYPGFYLRIYPWAAGRLLHITTPLKTGLFQSPVVYEEFPFSLHDYEFLRPADLPLNPSDYQASWSAFCGEGRVAGLLWPGATELCYGLHWMPSVIYSTPPVEQGEDYTFPTYYFYCGAGDYKAVAGCWQSLFGAGETLHIDSHKRWGNPMFPVKCRYSPVLAMVGQKFSFTACLLSTAARSRQGELLLQVPGLFAGTATGEDTSLQDSSIIQSGMLSVADPAHVKPAGEPLHYQKWIETGRRRWRLFTDILKKWLPFQGQRAKTETEPGQSGSRLISLKEQSVNWQQPLEVNHPLYCAGDPGPQRVSLVWREGVAETSWSLPVFVLGKDGDSVQVKQHRDIWQVDNGFLQLKLAQDFDGSLIQLKAAGRHWLHTGYPKKRPLGGCPHSTGGAKFFAVTDSRDWLVTLSGEEIPWGYETKTFPFVSGDLPWQGLLLNGQNPSGHWREASVKISFLTLPGSPVVLALAMYENNGSKVLEFDSVFSMYANPGTGQRFLYSREDHAVELSHDEHKEVAFGEGFGALVSEEGALGIITSPSAGGQVCGRHGEGGPWQMLALQRVRLQPGERQRVAVYLVVAKDKEQVWDYRMLAETSIPWRVPCESFDFIPQ
ncbi:MAG: GNAT family N-acetyltransferase [Bacillota bacterium]